MSGSRCRSEDDPLSPAEADKTASPRVAGGHAKLECSRLDGGCSSGVERLTVAQEVAGSRPVTHPNTSLSRKYLRRFRYLCDLDHQMDHGKPLSPAPMWLGGPSHGSSDRRYSVHIIDRWPSWTPLVSVMRGSGTFANGSRLPAVIRPGHKTGRSFIRARHSLKRGSARKLSH